MEVGDRMVLEIGGSAHDGSGVARHEGFAVFVEGALPGEKVAASVTEKGRTFARAQALDVMVSSPLRVKPFCKHFGDCGGCSLQHCAYEGQLSMKRSIVKDAFERIGRMPETVVLPTIGAQTPLQYRNKSEYRVEAGVDGSFAIGFRKRSSHSCVDIEECGIVPRSDIELIAALRELMAELNPVSGLCIRHAVVRTGEDDAKMLVLVSAAPPVAGHYRLADMLRERMPNLTSVYHNFNSRQFGEVLGWRNTLLSGQPKISKMLAGMTFDISPASFFQVNTAQAERLYQVAVDFALSAGPAATLDLYCGIGAMTLMLARKANKVMGVELNREAVDDARKNAESNGIMNASFLSGWVEGLMKSSELQDFGAEVAVIDPPRTGCDAEVLDSLCGSKVRRIAYVSCNPATLARDAVRLSAGGFRVTKVQPVDMFPHTSHIEAVCLMERA